MANGKPTLKALAFGNGMACIACWVMLWAQWNMVVGVSVENTVITMIMAVNVILVTTSISSRQRLKTALANRIKAKVSSLLAPMQKQRMAHQALAEAVIHHRARLQLPVAVIPKPVARQNQTPAQCAIAQVEPHAALAEANKELVWELKHVPI